jgi:HAD superfamily hydrolase (TIGR01456 family)
MSATAAIIDIDGVLIHGRQAIPGARESLLRLQAAGVPHVFVTNGGGVPSREKSQGIAKILELPAMTGPVIMAHDPMPEQLRRHGLWEKQILVLSKSERLSREVALEWGLPNPLVLEDFLASSPWVWPLEDDGREIQLSGTRVAAICVVATPHDWGQTLQLCVDLIRHRGALFGEIDDATSRPLLFVSNPDFDYRARPPASRMTTGAWLAALEALCIRYQIDLKSILTITGKPHRPIYQLAESYFAKTHKTIETVFCIGDNPTSDILGAQNYSHFKSILVLTGVAQEDDKRIPADFICRDICAATDFILKHNSSKSISKL